MAGDIITPISQLTPATSVNDTDIVPISQSGQAKAASVSQLLAAGAGAPTSGEYLLANQNANIQNSRYISAANGITYTDAGPNGALTIKTMGTLSSLASVTAAGMLSLSNSVVQARTLQVGTSGLAVTNGDGASGDPTIALADRALSIQNLYGPGIVVSMSGAGYTPRFLQGTTSQIAITNSAGQAGDLTIGIATDPVIPGTGGMSLPSGTSAERPAAPPAYTIRGNSSLGVVEYYDGLGGWITLAEQSGTNASYRLNDAFVGQQPNFNIDDTSDIAFSMNNVGATNTVSASATLTATTISAGTYGTTSTVSQVTFDTKGRATSATDVAISITGIGGVPTGRQVIAGAGMSGGGALTGDVTLALPSVITATGPLGTHSAVAQVTVDTYGRVTTLTEIPISAGAIGAVTTVYGSTGQITSTISGTGYVIAMPTALDFTGKTVSGGTYSGGTWSGGSVVSAAISGGTISAPTLSGLITGTYTLSGTPTLSGLTITGGSVISGNISGGTLSAVTLSGLITGTYTLSGSPTISGVTITGATIRAGSVSGAAISGGTLSAVTLSGLITGTYTLSGTPTISGVTITGSTLVTTTMSGGTISGSVATTAFTLSGAMVVSGGSTLATISSLGNVSGTVTIDFTKANNYEATASGGNITVTGPTSCSGGQSGTISFLQGSGGSYTITWNSIFKWAGGSAPAASTASGARDTYAYFTRSSTYIEVSQLKGLA